MHHETVSLERSITAVRKHHTMDGKVCKIIKKKVHIHIFFIHECA